MKYAAETLRQKAIGAFASTCVFILQIEHGIEDRLQVFYNVTDADGYLLGHPSWCRVRYTLKGEGYILHHGRRYHLKTLLDFNINSRAGASKVPVGLPKRSRRNRHHDT